MNLKKQYAIYSILYNSIYETLAGYALKVKVILHADQSLKVIDDGRGVPIDIHPEEEGFNSFIKQVIKNNNKVLFIPDNL